MGTFDAGSIEAKLVLDRSDFDRKLAEAQAKAQKFESDDATKKLNVEADTSAAAAQIAAIEAEIKSLESAKVGVDVDDAAAKAKIDALKAKLATIRNAHANIDVDTGDSGARVAALKSEIAAIPDKKTVKIDVDEGNGVSRTQAMVSAILAGLPLIPAVAAPAAAGIAALAASLTAAAGGAAVLGLGLIGAVKHFQAIQKAGGQMNPQMMMFKNALDAIQKAYAGFVKATEGRAFELMASGLNIVAGILPRLVPIFNAFADVAGSALTGLGNWFNGPEGQGMLTWFQTFGAQQFGTILSILGNLGRVILNLLEAFSPLATQMTSGLETMTAGWVTWSQSIATNQGFQQFIAYVTTVGPLLITTLGNVVDAIINIAVALAPLGIVMLGVINDFANFISAMNPDALRVILVIVGGLVLAWTAFEAVMSVVRAGMAMWSGIMAVVNAAQAVWNFLIVEGRVQSLAYLATQAALRVATLAWTAAQWLLNAALTANPIGIVVVAIVALVAVLILAWQHSETFRTVVTAAWNAVKTAAVAVFGVVKAALVNLVGQLVNGWNTIRNTTVSVWNAVRNAVTTAWNAVVNATTSAGSAIRNAVVSAWNAVRNAVVSAGNAIRNAVVSAWNAIRAAVVAAGNAIRNAVVAAWNAVRNAVTTALRTIGSVLMFSVNGWRSLISGAMSAIRSVVSSTWNAIRSVVTSAVNAVKSAVSSGFNAARSVAVSAFNSLRSGASSAINGLVGVVSGAVGRIRGFLAGAGSWLWNAGWSIINGLISGIKAGIGALGSALGGIGSFIASHKGPPSYDRVMLRPHGRMIMGGLIRGFEDYVPKLGGTLNRVTRQISGISARPSIGGLGGGSGSGGGVTVNQHIYYPVAEKSSVTTTRSMKELAVLGVFG